MAEVVYSIRDQKHFFYCTILYKNALLHKVLKDKFSDLSFISQLKECSIERMDGLLAILHPFQQYFSHIRMIGDDSERLCAIELLLQF